MSRPDRAAWVAVDFAPPRRPSRARPIMALVVAIVAIGAAALAVTQLLLR